MKHFIIFRYAILLIACCMVGSIQASDLQKEKRWREQIVDALLDGEAIDLNDGQHDFLAIYTEGEGKPKTGVILMHGIGIHPDYPTVINPLRVGLAERGWSTLSLQLPILPNEAENKDYLPLVPQAAPRVRAGVEYLQKAGLKHIIVVAHSMGTTMAVHALKENAADIDGFIVIGMGPAGIGNLKAIKVPVLDLYGENDLAGVVSNASRRRTAAASNKHYTQIMAKDADHFFNGQEEELIRLVASWLDKQSK